MRTAEGQTLFIVFLSTALATLIVYPFLIPYAALVFAAIIVGMIHASKD